jgi:cell division protein FtsB
MSRNRKNQSAAIRFGPVLKVVLLCSLFCGSGIGYVWQKNQIDELGRQRVKREQELKTLQDQNDKLRKQLSMMCSPKYLEAKVKELNLGLVQAQPSQRWRLRETQAEMAGLVRDRQYAGQ